MNEDRKLGSDIKESVFLTELERVEGSTLPLCTPSPRPQGTMQKVREMHVRDRSCALQRDSECWEPTICPGPQASLGFNESRNSLSSASIYHTNVL